MKQCPYCGEENLDQAVTCYYCGRDLPPAVDNDVEPTQPRHVQGRGAPAPTQPYPPPQSYTGYTQPYQPPQYPAQSPSQQPYPPGYYPQQGQPPQRPPYYPPPQQIPPQYPAPPERSRLWGVVPIFLGLILLCVCLVAAWAVADTANRGVARIGDQIATGAAGIFGGSAATDVPAPTPIPEEPSPWPTFTPEITAVPEPTSGYAEKLLSPECYTALDTLSGMTTQLSDEPLKLLEEDWRAGFNQARLDLTTYCGTLDAASPVPGHVQDAHNALTQANAEYDLANQILQDAVDGRNPAKILEAAQHFGQAARSLNEALAAIRAVVE